MQIFKGFILRFSLTLSMVVIGCIVRNGFAHVVLRTYLVHNHKSTAYKKLLWLSAILSCAPHMVNHIQAVLKYQMSADSAPVFLPRALSLPIRATPFADYYFAALVGNITMNSFDGDKPAAIHSSLNNQTGLVVDVNNYLDTAELVPTKLTVGISFR